MDKYDQKRRKTISNVELFQYDLLHTTEERNIVLETVADTLHLQLFGTFEARLNDHPLPKLRCVKGSMLLAYLALKRDREVTHSALADALWPDSDDRMGNLSKTLFDLRRPLGARTIPTLSRPHATPSA